MTGGHVVGVAFLEEPHGFPVVVSQPEHFLGDIREVGREFVDARLAIVVLLAQIAPGGDDISIVSILESGHASDLIVRSIAHFSFQKRVDECVRSGDLVALPEL